MTSTSPNEDLSQIPSQSLHQKESTFKAFSPSEAKNYLQNRRNYHPEFYATLLNTHVSTGGQLHTVVDVGCGPGTATQSLAKHFDRALGVDPGEGMIEIARQSEIKTRSGERIRFLVGGAEELGDVVAREGVRDRDVDMITAATAAHWFDMSKFYAQAAKLLKPSGTLALWMSAGFSIASDVPNAAAIQQVIDGMHDKYLDPYRVRGNYIGSSLLRELPHPWDISPPVTSFRKADFIRKEWGTGEGSADGTKYHEFDGPVTLDMLEKILSTGSPVVRWREAHPELVGTENDVVKIIRREIEGLMREMGVKEGEERLWGGAKAALLVFKKSVD